MMCKFCHVSELDAGGMCPRCSTQHECYTPKTVQELKPVEDLSIHAADEREATFDRIRMRLKEVVQDVGKRRRYY